MLKKLLVLSLTGALYFHAATSHACDKAKVFQVTNAKDLIGGPKAEGQIGDYKICNEKIEVIVEGKRMSDGLMPYGGLPIDIVRTDGTRSDLYGEFLPLFNLGGYQIFRFRAFEPTSFKTEMRGDKAILIVEGKDALWPILEGLLRMPTSSHNLNLIFEYELSPGSNDLVTRIKATPAKKTTVTLGMGYMMGDGLERFAPELGYDLSKTTNKRFDWLGASSPGFSAVWAVEGSDYQVIFSQGTYFFGQYKKLPAEPGKPALFTMHTLIGDGEVETMRWRANELATGKKLPKVSKLTVELQGPPLPNLPGLSKQVQVHLAKVGEDGGVKFYSTAKTTGLPGPETTSFMVEPGKYRVLAGELGIGAYVDQLVEVKDQPVSITAKKPMTGQLSLKVMEKGKGAIPSLVLIRALGEVVELPPVVGQKTLSGKFVRQIFAGPWAQTIALLPGRYEVIFSQGFEYNMVRKEVVVVAGNTVNLTTELVRQVDTKNWFSADFHLHAMPSPDSDDSLEEKVLALGAFGVEIPVATDHNFITDYQPDINRLKMTAFQKSIIGMELTTFTFGHFNTFPMKYEPEKANNGFDLVDYHNKTVPELFAFVRHHSGQDVITQLNHPRAPSVGGFFNATSYQRTLGKAVNEKNFPKDFRFDLIEAFNGKRVDQLEETLPDWYSFLGRGKKVWSVGNSDSHHAKKYEIGYPRTYVKLPTDNLKETSVAGIIKGVRQGKMTVSGGHFVTIGANGKGMGELASAKGGKVKLSVKVQAADWIDANTMQVIVNGKTVKTITIPPSKKVMRLNQEISLDLEKDSFVLVRVDGKNSLEPVYPGATPTSFTNPIFFDVDGNGKFDGEFGGSW